MRAFREGISRLLWVIRCNAKRNYRKSKGTVGRRRPGSKEFTNTSAGTKKVPSHNDGIDLEKIWRANTLVSHVL
jgi:hypothetical protein